MTNDLIARLARLIEPLVASDAKASAELAAILAESTPTVVEQTELPLPAPAAPKRRRPMGSSSTEAGVG
jgi:hypothetical protein